MVRYIISTSDEFNNKKDVYKRQVNGGKQMTSILIIAVGGGVQPNRAYSTGCRFFIDKSIIGAECVSAPLDT